MRWREVWVVEVVEHPELVFEQESAERRARTPRARRSGHARCPALRAVELHRPAACTEDSRVSAAHCPTSGRNLSPKYACSSGQRRGRFTPTSTGDPDVQQPFLFGFRELVFQGEGLGPDGQGVSEQHDLEPHLVCANALKANFAEPVSLSSRMRSSTPACPRWQRSTTAISRSRSSVGIA